MLSLSLTHKVRWLLTGVTLSLTFLAGNSLGAAKEGALAQLERDDAQSPAAADRLERDGLVVEFSTTPLRGAGAGQTALTEGDHAEVKFRITDAENGLPVRGLYPGVWMDIGKAWKGKQHTEGLDCKARVGMYLAGTVGMRPLIDLNSYFVLVMNQDSTITVIDPLVGITGITKLYAQINLKRPGADWAKSADEKRLFVSLPQADEVAVVDLDTFKVANYVSAGTTPMRIALQPDEKYLWVGNDSETASENGITVIDVETLSVAGFIPTGSGHHEIAFSSDSRYAFVSNRSTNSVSIIDVHRLERVKDVETGPLPISLAYSALSQMLYVADGKSGVITVVDGKRHDIVTRIDAKPGLGPLRFSADGRWGVVANTHENVVNVIDAASNRVAYTIPVGAKPYAVSFTRAFAYVRSLGTERVSMIELQLLGKANAPPVVTFAAGAVPPGKVADLGMADVITEAAGEAAVLVTSPGDATVYYYMEGMNAPTGNFRNYGHRPRAVEVADRTLREEAPGVYSAKVKLPAAGTYDVAFLLDTPRMLHCFNVKAKPDPELERQRMAHSVQYLLESRKVTAREPVPLRFRLTDGTATIPRTDLADVRVLFFRSPGRDRTEVPAREIGDGIYEAALSLPRAGAYFVYVGSPSVNIRYDDLPYVTLVAERPKSATGAAGQPVGVDTQKTTN